jgi:ammonia channel protein AmtB
MPLSDEEQKILREIEAQLSASDPALVEHAKTTVYKHAGRNVKWAALGFVAGLVLIVCTFASSLFAAFAGFLVMLACLFVIERNARKLGKAGLRDLTGWRGEGGMSNFLGETGRNLRTRFHRDDN